MILVFDDLILQGRLFQILRRCSIRKSSLTEQVRVHRGKESVLGEQAAGGRKRQKKAVDDDRSGLKRADL